MGIFNKKSAAPVVRKCDACGAAGVPGERPHEYSHIAAISLAEPSWLPENLRKVAQGEYTFRCDRCDSFPSIKWPSESGAFAGMNLHLAVAHRAGMLGSSGMSPGSVNFDMIRVS